MFYSFKKGIFVFPPYGIMLSLRAFNSENDMGTSELQFIFGQDLSEAS